MAEKETARTAQAETPAPEKPKPGKAEQAVQSRVDKETAQGFLGTKVDPEPNESYTVAGVTGDDSK